MNAQEPVSIDHDLVCPFLLRCFWVCNARPNTAREYNTKGQRGEARMPMNEVKIYVWRDTTLRQITELLQDSVPPVRYPDSVLEYGLVYPDKSGLNVLKFVCC
jgi:histone deacetylase complex subunit SAP18